MNIVETRQLPPAGWYVEPTHGVGQRYWDGEKWTEHVYVSGQQYTSPIVTVTHTYATGEKPKTRIYWSNLFRVRTWWFSLFSGIIAVFLTSLIGISGEASTVIFVMTVIGVGWFWLTQQMACRQCGSLLRVTRLTGGQEVCSKCNAPTDKSLS